MKNIKLFNCSAICDGYDYKILLVGDNQDNVLQRIYTILEDEIVYSVQANEILEVDGYNIILEKKE